jgi:hypothetical protein
MLDRRKNQNTWYNSPDRETLQLLNLPPTKQLMAEYNVGKCIAQTTAISTWSAEISPDVLARQALGSDKTHTNIAATEPNYGRGKWHTPGIEGSGHPWTKTAIK